MWLFAFKNKLQLSFRDLVSCLDDFFRLDFFSINSKLVIKNFNAIALLLFSILVPRNVFFILFLVIFLMRIRKFIESFEVVIWTPILKRKLLLNTPKEVFILPFRYIISATRNTHKYLLCSSGRKYTNRFGSRRRSPSLWFASNIRGNYPLARGGKRKLSKSCQDFLLKFALMM